MDIQFTGKDIVITPALKDFTNEKLSLLLNHFPRIKNIQVIFFLEGQLQCVEANVAIDSIEINASAKNNDMYIAVDELRHKLSMQLEKHKEKLIDNHR